MYYVYILYSSLHNKYYVGQTSDLTTRLLFHNQLAEGSFTSKYRPWELKVALEVSSRSVALRLEKYIKRKKRRTYLEALIKDEEFRTQIISQFEA